MLRSALSSLVGHEIAIINGTSSYYLELKLVERAELNPREEEHQKLSCPATQPIYPTFNTLGLHQGQGRGLSEKAFSQKKSVSYSRSYRAPTLDSRSAKCEAFMITFAYVEVDNVSMGSDVLAVNHIRRDGRRRYKVRVLLQTRFRLFSHDFFSIVHSNSNSPLLHAAQSVWCEK